MHASIYIQYAILSWPGQCWFLFFQKLPGKEFCSFIGALRTMNIHENKMVLGRWSLYKTGNKIPTMSMCLQCLHKLSTLCLFLEYHPNDSWLLFLYYPWFSQRSIAAVGNILILIHYSLINYHWITTHIAANYKL